MKKLILPLCIAAILAWFFQPVYMNEAGCNWFLLWIIIGIPFGMRRMLLMVPRGLDLGSTIGITVLWIIIGGLIGSMVLVFEILGGTASMLCGRKSVV